MISCLCLTRDRREWLPKAIACYQSQTFLDRELVVVADVLADVDGLIPDDPSIRVFYSGAGMSIGGKRNLGCQVACGEYVAHWDSDDWSAPTRLESQFVAMEASGKSVTGYAFLKFTDGQRWWQYRGDPVFALGTSLLYKKEFWEKEPFWEVPVPQKPEIKSGEDSVFVRTAINQNQLFHQGDEDLMWASIHPGNCSPRGQDNPRAGCWIKLPDYKGPHWFPESVLSLCVTP